MPPTRLSLARPICSFCDDLSGSNNTEVTSEITHNFFHRKCSTCEPQQDKTLCDRCRHLRISHLFFCNFTPLHEIFEPDALSTFDLKISPSQNCPFCQLLMSIINRQKSDFPSRRKEINKRFKNTCLRLTLDPIYEQMRLGLCVGGVLYPILPHEKFCRWETYKKTLSYRGSWKRSVPMYVDKKVRWDQVRGWLKKCPDSHKKCLEKLMGLDDQKGLPDGFMVIDVKDRKIVNWSKGCQFIALSYIWGNNPDNTKLRATEKTIERLRCKNSVSAHELPATIEDAIQICIELGEQYLWVDRLCIVQDDHENKQHQISRMASIYASASLVIVVTEGDMESGIAGIRHERPRQKIQVFSESEFSYGLPSIGDSIEHSRWATRGWTYQEAVLARKKLFFTPNQVYYMCNSTIRSENVDCLYWRESFAEKSMKLHPWIGTRFEKRPFDYWGHHLKAYTARSLSHSSDIYNAFIGICSAIYIEDDALICGLPRQSFNQALLWCCTTPAEDASPHQIRTREKDEDLPSWSWSSVIGQVSLNGSGARRWEFCGSLVEWAVKRSAKSYLEQVQHPDYLERESSHHSKQLYMAVAWNQGCLKKPWPFPQLFETTFYWLGKLIETRRICARDYLWGWDKDLDEKLQKELQRSHWLRDKTLLVSRAETARFRLEKHRPHRIQPHYEGDPKHHLLEVINGESQCIGMLAESEPRVKDEVWSSTGSDTFEFVALSISCYRSDNLALQCVLQRDEELLRNWEDLSGYNTSSFTGGHVKPRGILWQRRRNLTFYDRDRNPLDPIPVVNVMLIGRDRLHSRLAHRVSIGWILHAQWAKAERQFKTIILE